MALKNCVNIAGVALVQNTTVFDRCLYCLTICQVVSEAFQVELDKGATLESLDNQIWKDAFQEDKLSCLTVDFRSLPEKPRRDKQDFTVVEQYPLAPSSMVKRWKDQPLDFIEVLSGSYFRTFLWCQTSMFLSQGHASSIIMQVFCVFWKNKYVWS